MSRISEELRADLVAFSLGQLSASDTDALRAKIEEDPEVAAEFERIRGHLQFHGDNTPRIQPSAALFQRVREAVREESGRDVRPPVPAAPPERSWFRRYGLSLAAAGLLIAALIFPPGVVSPTPPNVPIETLAGAPLANNPDGSRFTTEQPSRIRYADGVVVTIDANTRIRPLDSRRLALVAGRIFLEVEPGNANFSVIAGGARVTTLGTSFLVETGIDGGRVAVDTGTVRLDRSGKEPVEVPAGQQMSWEDAAPSDAEAIIRWFEIPELSAEIVDDTTIRVVLRNAMMDVVQLKPPTGGKPLFYVTIGSHNYPHMPHNHSYNTRIAPGGEYAFSMTVRKLKPNETVLIRCPSLGLEAEARR